MAKTASESVAPVLAPTLAPLGDAPRVALRRLADLGVRHVQLSATQPGLRPRELDRSARRDLDATIRRAGIAVNGVDLWIPPAHFVDPARVDRAIAAACAAVDLARDLGGVPVSSTLPVPTPDGDGADSSAPLATLLEHAHHCGVALADHARPPCGDPGAGVGIDPAAVLAAGDDPAEAAIRAGARLVSARLCDLLRSGLRGPIGDPQECRLDVIAYRAAVDVAGYRRPLVVDARQWVDPWGGLEQTLRAWAGP